MFESLILSSERKNTGLLLDINFENSRVGDQGIFDVGANEFVFTRRQSPGTPGTPDGVVDHPVIGKSYYFNGYTSFVSSKLLQVSSQLGDVEIEIEFLPTANPSYMTLIFTGGFSAGIRGWNYYLQPTNRGSYSVLFVMEASQAGGNISIQNGLPASVALQGELVKNKLFLRKATDTWGITNMNTGGTTSSGVKKLSSEGFFAIGSDNSNTGLCTGYLKSIKARVII